MKELKGKILVKISDSNLDPALVLWGKGGSIMRGKTQT